MNLAAIDAFTVRKLWRRSSLEGLSFYQSTALRSMPGLSHGFTTRIGGCSESPFTSLNLGDHVGDVTSHVNENRSRVASALGFDDDAIATAEQVHKSAVGIVTKAGLYAGIDSLVTNVPNILLMLMFADCVPIFLFDPLNRAIGLIHSGWKGTEQNIVSETVNAMRSNFGTEPTKCVAAVGPCISFEKYEVSLDVAERFRNLNIGRSNGSANFVAPANEFRGTYLLNLRQIVFQQLNSAGFRLESIIVSDQCTYTNSKDFYSHRRDGVGGAKTGRMAAVMGLKPLKRPRGII